VPDVPDAPFIRDVPHEHLEIHIDLVRRQSRAFRHLVRGEHVVDQPGQLRRTELRDRSAPAAQNVLPDHGDAAHRAPSDLRREPRIGVDGLSLHAHPAVLRGATEPNSHGSTPFAHAAVGRGRIPGLRPSLTECFAK
jgi:hypothetical protein